VTAPTSSGRRIVGGAVLAGAFAAACAAPSTAGAGAAAPMPSSAPGLPAARVTPDSTSSTLVPAGFGTLRQDDISIKLQSNDVAVYAIPLDESVIRALAPDSYRSLRARLDSRRVEIARRAAMHDVRDPRVWFVRFTGLAADARFVPTDFTVTSGGRDYRPFDVIPLTSGFGEETVQPRIEQSGLLLFDEGVDISQPLTVTMGTERNTDWTNILTTLDRERAAIRARAAGRP
jgi:hypothetical protein